MGGQRCVCDIKRIDKLEGLVQNLGGDKIELERISFLMSIININFRY